MEILLLIGVIAKYVIIGLASLVGAVVFLRKAIKNEEHRARNIILGECQEKCVSIFSVWEIIA